MKTQRHQRGFLTAKNALLFLLLFLFIPFAVKVGTAYSENTFVEAALKNAGALEPPLIEMTKSQIKSKINSVFGLNNIRGAPVDAIEVVKNRDDVFVNVNYEVRENLFFNIDLVMTFENQLDLDKPELCCEPKKSKQKPKE
ncbi:DUF4845 domain-containing protein [Exilibacterium tricleocarpae]|uniref:DUF4845 domain-containing protein n=1 Tax=Exilibacterium tricleocarpae TaxID=2591008 RepID=A0A545U3K4_9GAMM|nr:DUF4845 domain-containing protein [Exilibacterium tricleocarpae]TQV84051.1 DUF4845 domain-containing protein [Exilibacterium tricleocarpae]